jgi:transposase
MTQRQTFTKVFKAEAVRLLEQSGKPAADLARELGVRRNQLYKWQVQAKAHGKEAFPGYGHQPKPADDVARLKRELARVTEERDILKKAVVGSMGRCDTLYSFPELGGVIHGTDGTTRAVRDAEGGVVATMEAR